MHVRMAVLSGIGLFVLNAAAQDAPPLKSPRERLSYALGMDLGSQFKRQEVDIDPDVFARALRDALGGKRTLLTEQEVREAIAGLQNEIKTRMNARAKTAGDAFLAQNKGKEGVVTLASGLQYKILQTGAGNRPTLNDTVVCHYRGTLIDGTEFDSSYRRNQPATFPVKGVIKGWTEALQLMPVGSKWQLWIPPELAYGEAGTGPIQPNSTLIFEVELISIQAK